MAQIRRCMLHDLQSTAVQFRIASSLIRMREDQEASDLLVKFCSNFFYVMVISTTIELNRLRMSLRCRRSVVIHFLTRPSSSSIVLSYISTVPQTSFFFGLAASMAFFAVDCSSQTFGLSRVSDNSIIASSNKNLLPRKKHLRNTLLLGDVEPQLQVFS